MHVHKGDPLFEISVRSTSRRRGTDFRGTPPSILLMPRQPIASTSESDNLVASANETTALDIAEEDIEAIANAEKAPKTVTFSRPASGEVMDKMVVEGFVV